MESNILKQLHDFHLLISPNKHQIHSDYILQGQYKIFKLGYYTLRKWVHFPTSYVTTMPVMPIISA